jgi:hypothetical protein
MIEPKDLPIQGHDGIERVYILTKFPAVAGREIVTQYPLSATPKLGDYATNEELMLKIMRHVWVRTQDGKELNLSTRTLVDNHVPDWEVLAKLEFAMLEYNCSFFANGGASTFLEVTAQKGQAWITQMLTDLLVQLSQKSKPPSAS